MVAPSPLRPDREHDAFRAVAPRVRPRAAKRAAQRHRRSGLRHQHERRVEIVAARGFVFQRRRQRLHALRLGFTTRHPDGIQRGREALDQRDARHEDVPALLQAADQFLLHRLGGDRGGVEVTLLDARRVGQVDGAHAQRRERRPQPLQDLRPRNRQEQVDSNRGVVVRVLRDAVVRGAAETIRGAVRARHSRRQRAPRGVRVVALLAGAPPQGQVGARVRVRGARAHVRGRGRVVQHAHPEGVSLAHLEDVPGVHRARVRG